MGIQDWEDFQRAWRPQIDVALEEILTGIESAPRVSFELNAAMRYALMGPGKRLRPLLVLAAAHTVGQTNPQILKAACSLELVHAYSLVHDDLPAMDDDDFRRGRPSCHKQFSEALAVLAGDGLLTHAFYVLAEAVPPESLTEALKAISKAAGPWGMVAGQAEDVRTCLREDLQAIERVHLLKTAALFEAAVELGALLSDASLSQRTLLVDFARNVGLAYQIADDVLAFLGYQKSLGRPTSSDVSKKRNTFPRGIGLERSETRLLELLKTAEDCLQEFGSRKAVLFGFLQMVRQRGCNETQASSR